MKTTTYRILFCNERRINSIDHRKKLIMYYPPSKQYLCMQEFPRYDEKNN